MQFPILYLQDLEFPCVATIKGLFVQVSSKLNPLKWPTDQSKKSQVSLKDLMIANSFETAKGTLVFDLPVTYCTKIIKVDSKHFGVPQTRERVYMFVWRPDHGNVDDDLGDYWHAIVRHLESPVRHSLEAFMLQVDHDIIRVFREGKISVKLFGRQLDDLKFANYIHFCVCQSTSRTCWQAYQKSSKPRDILLDLSFSQP